MRKVSQIVDKLHIYILYYVYNVHKMAAMITFNAYQLNNRWNTARHTKKASVPMVRVSLPVPLFFINEDNVLKQTISQSVYINITVHWLWTDE